MADYNVIVLARQIQTASPEELSKRVELIEQEMSMYNAVDGFPNIMCHVELMMITQRCLEIVREEMRVNEMTEDGEHNNPKCWMVIPMYDDKKYWLNEYGRREWKNTIKGEPDLIATRAYYWVDRVLILDENRMVMKDVKFSEFIKNITGSWIPVMPEEKK